MLKYENLNIALIMLSRKLLEEGIIRESDEREFKCKEIYSPVLICIENPSDRYITIPERSWAKNLAFAEALWIAAGCNHMELVNAYSKQMKEYSDDQVSMRAAYGPRIRAFSGFSSDYAISDPAHRNVISGTGVTVDQLKFVVESFKRDINTRQAEITIHDPAKDDFNQDGTLKKTKDTPCCRTLNFIVRDGKLDVTLDIRSNDLFWGLSAVNVFNFTFMQEYVANLIGVPVGKYYHFVKNLHFYTGTIESIQLFAAQNPDDYKSKFGKWQYPNENPMSFEEWDKEVTKLFRFEQALRETGEVPNVEFINPLFTDWSRIFLNRWDKSGRYYTFMNPYLNKLFKFDMKLKVNNLVPEKVNYIRQEFANAECVAVDQGSKVFYQTKIDTTVKQYIAKIEMNGQKGRYMGKTDDNCHLNFKN